MDDGPVVGRGPLLEPLVLYAHLEGLVSGVRAGIPLSRMASCSRLLKPTHPGDALRIPCCHY
jgi:hypothetical protein